MAKPDELQERVVNYREPFRVPGKGDALRVIVKFRDYLKARVGEQGQIVLSAAEIPGELLKVIKENRIRFTQALPQYAEAAKPAALIRAEKATGEEQFDFGGLLVAQLQVPNRSDQIRIARQLYDSPLVEYVELEARDTVPPPPGDILPQTANFVGRQKYRGPNPGMNINHAWLHGGRGDGVRISNCEYAFDFSHEDLAGLGIKRFGTPHSKANQYKDHGTAMMGILAAGENGYGITGLVPNAQVQFFTEYPQSGWDRPATISKAIDRSRAGDVILLEMQTHDFEPAEVSASVFQLTRMATKAGIIVVAAGGNGSLNLDGPQYAFYRNRGDSGAIVVGGGTPDKRHIYAFSGNVGRRLNLQGWAQGVVSTGRGDLAKVGGDTRQSYTKIANGTSSASALVAGAVASLQSVVLKKYRYRMSPKQIRDLMVATGTPQGAGVRIGKHPDLAAAIVEIETYLPPTVPRNFSLTKIPTSRRVDLSWTPSTFPGTYRVYRSIGKNGKKVLVGKTGQAAINNINTVVGLGNFFWIEAINANGSRGFGQPIAVRFTGWADLSIGASDTKRIGINRFSHTGQGQIYSYTTRGYSTRFSQARLENRSSAVGEFALKGGGTNRFFQALYRVHNGARWVNDTADFLLGRASYRLGPGQKPRFLVGVRPRLSLRGKPAIGNLIRIEAKHANGRDKDVVGVNTVKR